MLDGGSDDRSGSESNAEASSGNKEFGTHLTRDSGIVVARGTGDGLILRLDGRVEKEILLNTLLDYVESRRSFFSGQEVTLEWIEARPAEGVVSELSAALDARFQLLVKASRMFQRAHKPVSSDGVTSREAGFRSATSERGHESSDSSANMRLRPAPVTPKVSERAPLMGGGFNYAESSNFGASSGSSFGKSESKSLFDGVAALSGSGSVPAASERRISSESLLWDEADARIIRDTLRGGQKIESEHSVLIVGDVNSGAEIVAGGDIYVLGRLRGVAHAGAYDESGAGRRIFALQMQPTQLRIGSIISQGSEEGGRMPEMAKIEGNMIVVEPYGAGSQVRKLSK